MREREREGEGEEGGQREEGREGVGGKDTIGKAVYKRRQRGAQNWNNSRHKLHIPRGGKCGTQCW